MADAAFFSPIQWRDGSLLLLDQTLLPDQEVWLDCRTPEQVADAIRRLAVRGAPAIGVAAAYGLALGLAPGKTAGQTARLGSDEVGAPGPSEAAGSPRAAADRSARARRRCASRSIHAGFGEPGRNARLSYRLRA